MSNEAKNTCTTAAAGFAARFVALETYFHDLRVEVLMSIRDGKLDLGELAALREKLHTVDLNIAQTRRLLFLAEEELQHRAQMGSN